MDAELSFEDIGPELAQKYLGLNIDHNRTPLNDRIERMARDMRNGDWIPTADPIKFNIDGRLIDGQHRLRAVMVSQTTQRFVVARNVAEDAVYVIDTGATRTAAQAIKIAHGDSKNNSKMVAIAQVLDHYDRGLLKNVNGVINPRERLTNAEVVRYVETHRGELEEATRMAMWAYRSAPMPTSALGAGFVVLARVDRPAAMEFYNHIREGNSGMAINDPVSTLIRRVYADKMANRKTGPALSLFYLFRTWNAWREDEALSKLQTASATGVAVLPRPR